MRSVHDNQKSISLSLDALVHFKAKLKQGNLTPLIPEEEEFQLENHLFNENVLDLSLIVDFSVINDVSVVVE